MAHLQPHRVGAVAPGQAGVPAAARCHAEDLALLGLLELVAIDAGRVEVDRVLLEEAEVRVQVDHGLNCVGVQLEHAIGQAALEFIRKAVARGVPAVGRVERAEAADEPLVDGALRDLVGCVPARRIAHRRDRRAGIGVTKAVAQHAVQPVELFGVLPGAVVVGRFDGVEQVAWARFAGIGDQAARVAVLAERQRGNAFRQCVEQADVGRSGRSEVAFVGEVRPLLVGDAVHEFGQQPVQVAVAMAVRVRRHVHRHAGDEAREVGAMVEVEAAQEILVRLAITAVLGDDHTGHEFQHFGRAQGGPAFDQPGGDRALARGIGTAHCVDVVALHRDGLELCGGGHNRRGLCGGEAAGQGGQCEGDQVALERAGHRVSPASFG